MPKAIIYKPSKTAMQSGVAKTKEWVFEYLPEKKDYVDNLMGWIGSEDMLQEVHIKFDSKEAAIEFANNKGVDYEVIEPKQRKIKPKSYAENFQ